jgi:opacity protein-like surface antigen
MNLLLPILLLTLVCLVLVLLLVLATLQAAADVTKEQEPPPSAHRKRTGTAIRATSRVDAATAYADHLDDILDPATDPITMSGGYDYSSFTSSSSSDD